MALGRNERYAVTPTNEQVKDATSVIPSRRMRLSDIMSHDDMRKSLETLLALRLARIDNDFQSEWLKANPFKTLDDMGYEYDPEHNEWGINTKDESENGKHPWFATTRDALDAIYNSFADRDDVENDVDLEDVYGTATDLLKGLVDRKLDSYREKRENENTPTQDELDYMQRLRDAKIIGNLVAQPLELSDILTGNGIARVNYEKNEEPDGVLPYQPTTKGIVDWLVPTRSAREARDPELKGHPMSMPLDAAEMGLTMGLPIGRVASKLIRPAARAFGKVPVLGKFLNNVAGSNKLTQMAEGFLGNSGAYTGVKGMEQVLDPENRMHTPGFSGEGALASGIVGAAIPGVVGTVAPKQLASMQSWKDKARQKMLDRYRKNMSVGDPELQFNDVPDKDVDEMMGPLFGKKPSVFDYKNKPYSEMQAKGYKQYDMPMAPEFDKALSKNKGDQALVFKDMLKDAMKIGEDGERAKAWNEWYNMNSPEFNALMNGIPTRTQNMGGVPYKLSHTEYANAKSATPELDTKFRVPVKAGENAADLSEKELEKRFGMVRAADAERKRRDKFAKGIVDNDNATLFSEVAPSEEIAGQLLKKYGGMGLPRMAGERSADKKYSGKNYKYKQPKKGEE